MLSNVIIIYFSKGNNLQQGNLNCNFSKNQRKVNHENKHDDTRKSRSLAKYPSARQLSSQEDTIKGASTSKTSNTAHSKSMY